MKSMFARGISRITSERFRRVGREAVLVSLGQAAAIIGSLFGVRLLTGLLSPKVYGELALAMTASTLVSQVILGPISTGAMRFYGVAKDAGNFRDYLAAVCNLAFKATGTLLFVVVIVVGLVLTWQANWVLLGVMALVFALISGFNSVLSGIQNAARQRTVVAFHQGLETWLRFLIAAGLILWIGARSNVALLGYVLAVLIVFVSQLAFFKRFVCTAEAHNPQGAKAKTQWEKQIFNYSWPFAFWGVFTWVQMATDRWSLQLLGSGHDVGLYAALYQIGYYPISIAAGLVVQFVAPIMFQRAGDAENMQKMKHVYELNWYLIYIALGLTAFGFVIAFLFHDFIFRVFVAAEYWSVAYLLPWMVLAGGLFASGQTAVLNLLSFRETRPLILPKVVTATIGVGLNYLGAAMFGIPGVVAACIVFGGVYLVWILILTVFKHKQLVSSGDACI